MSSPQPRRVSESLLRHFHLSLTGHGQALARLLVAAATILSASAIEAQSLGSDFGDAPDVPYRTLSASSGPEHTLSAASPIYLGSCVDSETDGQPTTDAGGDDAGAGGAAHGSCSDDEDGITFDSPLLPGFDADMTATVSASSFLHGWIDFGPLSFGGPADHILSGVAVSPGATPFSFPVPSTQPPGLTYARFRLSSSSGLSPDGVAPDGEVEDYRVVVSGLDFADAPDSYLTSLSSGGPHHVVNPTENFYLGNCVDTELDAQTPHDGSGDDTMSGTATVGTCSGGDEDGVVFPIYNAACFPSTVEIRASEPGLIDAWIDYGADGSFDPSDRILGSAGVSAGLNAFVLNVPCNAVPGATLSRFRFSRAGGLGPGGLADDGEVEDHPFVIVGTDFGDAADSYGTLWPSGPHHPLIPTTSLYLGSCVDSESDGQPAAASQPAFLDDTTPGSSTLGSSCTDDEDGVTFTTSLVACETATADIVASAPGRLDAWIDFNADGTFAPAEQIAGSQQLQAGVNAMAFLVPCNAVSTELSTARFRVSTLGNQGPTGAAEDGEVEDHPVSILGLDWGDAPNSYSTSPPLGARHAVNAAAPFHLGTCVDTEASGQPAAPGQPATVDDTLTGLSTVGTCTTGDEDGVRILSELVACEMASVEVTASRTGILNAWFDIDGDGVFGISERLIADELLNPGAQILSVLMPCSTNTLETTYARFRFSSQSGIAPTGLALDGEVEDFTISTSGVDFGDAPTSSGYPTLFADDGARHAVLANRPTLGLLVDTEPDGQPAPAHLGDDATAMDDEDGVVIGGTLIEGGPPVDFEITTGPSTGTLNAWVDWNDNGSWLDAGEQVATDVLLPGSSVVTLSVAAPPTAVRGVVAGRFRISSTPGIAPTGFASDGEVEDHAVAIGAEQPYVGLALELQNVQRLAASTYEVGLLAHVSNLGNVDLSSLQVALDLATPFALVRSFTVVTVTSADFSVSAAYDGDGQADLLLGADDLLLAETGTIALTLHVDPGRIPGPFELSAEANATSPSLNLVRDASQTGADPDPDHNGNPTDNDDPTELLLTLATIDIPTLGRFGTVLFIVSILGFGLALRRRTH